MEQIDKVLPMGRYPVDLDTEPEKRYDELFQKQEIQDLIPTLRQGVKDMMSVIPEEVRPLLVKLLAELDQCLPQPFAGEMRGIARCTGIDLGEIVGLNLGYDLSTFCTSIVAQDSKGTIWHGRNMDLVKEFAKTSEFLRSTAIMIDFQSKGQTLYTSTTYLGYVGAPTGQSPDKFTVSVNLRHQGALWMNALQALLNRKAKVMSFLVRETLTEADSYEAAVQRLAETPLIAPVYFIVGGANVAEGAVITRDRMKARDIWKLNPTEGRWFVLQTNYDRWEEPPTDDNRRTPATKAMEKFGQAGINASTMFQVLSVPLVLNDRTIHTVTMSAKQPEIYNSLIRQP